MKRTFSIVVIDLYRAIQEFNDIVFPKEFMELLITTAVNFHASDMTDENIIDYVLNISGGDAINELKLDFLKLRITPYLNEFTDHLDGLLAKHDQFHYHLQDGNLPPELFTITVF